MTAYEYVEGVGHVVWTDSGECVVARLVRGRWYVSFRGACGARFMGRIK